jgi:hypothetical protein
MINKDRVIYGLSKSSTLLRALESGLAKSSGLLCSGVACFRIEAHLLRLEAMNLCCLH